MTYIDIPEPSTAAELILVHGSWHDSRCWSEVQKHFATAGVRSIAPTLPGHGTDDDRRGVSHHDYVTHVLGALDEVGRRAVLVGHSFAGSVISRVAELRPEQCHGLVYCSAFVPRDGERVADSLPAPFIEFLDHAAASSPDRAITLPHELLCNAFANTADEQTLARIGALMVPEPHAPIFEPLSLPTFTSLEIPTVYINCRDDRSLPPGTLHPGQSSRLPGPELIEIEGDHESLLTAPARLADAVLEALDMIEARHVPRQAV